jgi:hypothetical protein
MQVVIHSMDGRLIMTQRLSPGPFSSGTGIEHGVFTYTLSGSDDQFVTGKFVRME